MIQQERDYTAKQYNHIRGIIKMKQHEEDCSKSIELFLMLAVLFVWAYAIYKVISYPGGFGW